MNRGLVVVAILLGACGPRAVEVGSAPAPVQQIRVTNTMSERLEIFVTESPGSAPKAVGELAAGATMDVAVQKRRSTPTIVAYSGRSITRAQVTCSYPTEQSGLLLVTCGKP